MDWKRCCKERIVKEITPDVEMATALRKSSANKWTSANQLVMSETTATSKISLAYDALREVLEALALERGYKIYNHECYTAFLSTQLSESDRAATFDGIRTERNAINYYGKDVSVEEARDLIEQIRVLLEHFRK